MSATSFDNTLPNFVLYSKSGCPSCVRLKEYLDSLGASYQVKDLSDDENGNARREAFYDNRGLTGTDRRVPKLFELSADGSEFMIGGEEDSKEYLDVIFS